MIKSVVSITVLLLFDHPSFVFVTSSQIWDKVFVKLTKPMYAIFLVFLSLYILTELVQDEESMSVLWSDTYEVDVDSVLSPLVFARASADSIAHARRRQRPHSTRWQLAEPRRQLYRSRQADRHSWRTARCRGLRTKNCSKKAYLKHCSILEKIEDCTITLHL